MFGLFNINKPGGVTSRDVVNHVQRLVRPAKAGHAGTLDPLARGVLVVAVGGATRLVQYVQRMPKRYTATFLLGRESNTEDVQGEVVLLSDPPRPARQQIEEALPKFIGQIQQRPPAFSALKVHGIRAYKLARRGEVVELSGRSVMIHGIRLLEYDYPELMLEVSCGSGTYIRSLGRDLAAALGTSAVMSALVRTAIGGFRMEEAIKPEQLTARSIESHLLPAIRAVESLPRMELTEEEAHRIAHGRTIEKRPDMGGEEIVALDDHGRLVAILTPRGKDELGPVRNFSGA